MGVANLFAQFIHIGVIALEALYTVMAFIMVRQVRLMNASFTTPSAPLFLLISRMHLLAALGITLLSLLILI